MDREKIRVSKFILAPVLALILVCMAPVGVFAASQTADRETTNYDVVVKVNENNSYDFTETIDAVFNTPGHGIYRYVPTEFDGISEDISHGWCSTDELSDEYDGSNYVMQIGSGDKTITGKHEFKLGYTLTMRDDRDTSGDILYIDVLPTNWPTAIGSSDITITLPKEIDKDAINVYSGAYKNKSLDSNVTWTYDGGKTIRIKGENLDKGTGITVKADLPEGYWVGQNDAQGNKLAVMIMCILMAIAFVLLWFKFGKRQDVVNTVEFHPPEGVTPAEIGLIIDGSLDKKDMVSMYMYFAQKGYMKIKELKKEFEFTKLKEIDESEKTFAKTLFDGTFTNGNTVKSNHLGDDFGYSYQAACEVLQDECGEVMPNSSKRIQMIEGILLYIFAALLTYFAGAYMVRIDAMPFGIAVTALLAGFMTGRIRKSYRNRFAGKKTGTKAARIIYWIIDAALLLAAAVMTGNVFGSVVFGALFFVSFAICQIMNVYFGKLSESALAKMGKVLGFREFIQTAELDKINQLVEEEPEYFFKVLPYAYVMGLTKKWVKKFEKIDIKMPGWYEAGSAGVFIPALYMGDAMNNMSGHMTSVAMPSATVDSDIGGGFSGGGGGFSGGGAGGGGGGFW